MNERVAVAALISSYYINQSIKTMENPQMKFLYLCRDI